MHETTEYINNIQFDSSSPDDTVRALQEVLNEEKFHAEQKLFILGYIVNRNKELYIADLKKTITTHKRKIVKLNDRIEELKKEPVPEPVKKKYVVRTKKKDG